MYWNYYIRIMCNIYICNKRKKIIKVTYSLKQFEEIINFTLLKTVKINNSNIGM